jgi:hypothetical protein
MTRMIRRTASLAAIGLLAATVATARVPDWSHCTFPAFIKVVGTRATVPDPAGTFSIIMRDEGNIPVSGCVVTLNFAACTDMRLCTGAGVTCSPAMVWGTTNVSGVVTFTVVGGGLHPGGTFAGPGAGCVEMRGDGYLMGVATAIVYDLNGATAGAGKNGVLITDLPLFLNDWHGTGLPYLGRSDYNQNGAVQITDLPVWLAVWGPANSSGGCATTYCP